MLTSYLKFKNSAFLPMLQYVPIYHSENSKGHYTFLVPFKGYFVGKYPHLLFVTP